MRFSATPLQGAFVIELDAIEDERGFFARTFCQQEFNTLSLESRIAQCNISFNRWRGTLRGLHYQCEPYQEAKLVRCTRGLIWDVIVDLRNSSPTRLRWFGKELDATAREAIYVPRGFAHGFQALEDNSEVFYQMSEFYHPEAALGVRWNDPAIGIEWPIPNPLLSERDSSFPLLGETTAK